MWSDIIWLEKNKSPARDCFNEMRLIFLNHMPENWKLLQVYYHDLNNAKTILYLLKYNPS